MGSGVYYPLARPTDTKYTDTNLVIGQSYNYKIYAVNAAGDGPMSLPVTGFAIEKPGIIR